MDSCLLFINLLNLNLLGEVPLVTRWLGYIAVGLQVAAGLGFVIFVHELGHFLAAKTFGVKCEKFYVGFDVPISIGPIRLPRTLGRFRWGETEYGIGIVPLGGYVKMLGQDDDPRNAEAEAERARQGGGPDAQLDPRSYQAKPVWQRMIIISAGVVMNVIFAVFLAAAAFLYGVPYSPTTIGGLPLGAPAWQAGLKPGDHVLQMAKMKQDDPYLRFEDMGGKTVIHGLRNGNASIPFTVDRDGNRLTVNVTPASNLHPDGYFLAGINSATVATLSAPPSKYSYLASQKIDLRAGDQVIAADGQPLPVDPDSGQILGVSLTDKLHAKWNQPIELTILRKMDSQAADATPGAKPAPAESATAANADSEELKISLPPVPVKTLGIGFAMGPITAVRKDSVAEVAGIKVGDILEKVAGQPVTDAMHLPMQVAEKIGSPIEFVVRRPADKAAKESTDQTLTFTMEAPTPVAFGSIGRVSAQFGLENYGIAYSVLPKVSSIDPLSSKASSSVQVGDELTQIKIEVTEDEIKEYAKDDVIISPKPLELSSLNTVAYWMNELQFLPIDLKIRCFLKRDNQVREVVLPIQYAKDWYWHQRGLPMTALEKIQKTENVAQSLTWGVTETGRRLGDVFEFLTILVTGRASPRNLAGPFGIAQVASQEASDSPSRLLLFLTLLSANLAILNFLPIPALDGGHLVFLIAEAIRGKPLNEALQVKLTMVGVMCLLGLMAFAILNDILRVIR
ncbi:MAG: site-2 protease family protein [Pirellulaceae bacterium]|nr:site-2 protease family protein [Pirellulaceae bacterium]